MKVIKEVVRQNIGENKKNKWFKESCRAIGKRQMVRENYNRSGDQIDRKI